MIGIYNKDTDSITQLAGNATVPIDDTAPATDKVYSSSKVESNISEYISLSKNIYTTDKTAGLLEYARKYYKLDNTKIDYLIRAYSTDGDYCIITIPFKYGEYYDSYNRAHSTTMYPTAWNIQGTVAFNKDIEKIEVIPMSRLESENYYKQLAMSSDVNWKVYTVPTENITSSVSLSNLYCAYNNNTLCIKGWIRLKAGTYSSKTEIFNIGTFVAGINSLVAGYTQDCPSKVYNFWLNGNSNSVIVDNDFTLSSETYLQFNTVIPLKV